MAKPNSAFTGPTAERLIHADGGLVIGDDQQGGKVYTFKDTALARVYGRLNGNPATVDRRTLEAEERALERYFTAYAEGGLHGSVGSSDFNGTGSSNPAGRDHAAKNVWQIDRRNDFDGANHKLSKGQRTVLSVVVLAGSSLQDAGFAIGHRSKTRAISGAEVVLRGAAVVLGKHWGMIGANA